MNKALERYKLVERAALLGVHIFHAQTPADGEIVGTHLFAADQNDIEDALDKIEKDIHNGKSHVQWIVLHVTRDTFPSQE